MVKINSLGARIMLNPAAILLVFVFSYFLFCGINQAFSGTGESNSELMAEAENYLRNNSYERAASIYKKVIAIDPGNVLAHQRLGTISSFRGQFGEAEAELKKALEIKPNYVLALNNLADVYLRTNRFEEALRLVNKAIEIEPQFYASYQTAGEIYEEMGEYDLAIKMFKKAVQDPEFREIAKEAIGRLEGLAEEGGG